MAIQGRNGKIKGKINNIVYRSLGGQQILQIAPSRVKQTYATKLGALEFGVASTHAKGLRMIFRKIYEESDGKMNGRLNAAVAACLRTSDKAVGERTLHDSNLDDLKGFQFNLLAPMESRITVRPTWCVEPTGRFRFKLSSFNLATDINYPPSDMTMAPSFTIVLIAIQFEKEYVQIIDHKTFAYSNVDQQAEINWECRRQLPLGTIVFAMFSLRYSTSSWLGKEIWTTNSAFYPTIVLDAFHVTEAMAASGVDANFDPPEGGQDEFGCMVNHTLNKVKEFKEKAAKKK